MECYIFTLDNIHCESCIASIQRVLAPLVPQPTQDYVLVDIVEQTVTVAVSQRSEMVKEKLSAALYDAGFDVLFIDAHALGNSKSSTNGVSSSLVDWIWSIGSSHKRSKKHKEHCDACQRKKKRYLFKPRRSASVGSNASSSSTVSGSTDSTLQEVRIIGAAEDQALAGQAYRAIFSVGGMTCAACQNSVTAAVEEAHPDVLEFAVDLMTKSAMAVVADKRLVNDIQQTVSDVGYDCQVMEVVPVNANGNANAGGTTEAEKTKKFKVLASIGGMTCASCVSTILAQTKDLPFMCQEASVNLIGNNAEFIIVDPETNIPKLKEAIEDTGYEFEVVSITPTLVSISKSRTVNLSVAGMFCSYVTSVL